MTIQENMDKLEIWGYSECYRKQYDIWDESSYTHPAKMSPGLCFKILKKLMQDGRLKPGDTVLDFMAGVGTTALCWLYMHRNNRAITVELEPRFIEMQEKNKKYIEEKLHRKVQWTILQGDSRYLCTILKERGLIGISSPPYADMISNKVGGAGLSTDEKRQNDFDLGRSCRTLRRYSVDPNNIGNLHDDMGKNQPGKVGKRCGYLKGTESLKNIASLPDRLIVVSSKSIAEDKSQRYRDGRLKGHYASPEAIKRYAEKVMEGYSDSEGSGTELANIGSSHGETYLSAMQKVFHEVAKVCPVLVTITKNPTRGGKLRVLDNDMVDLCAAAGYRLYGRAKAQLFEKVTQATLDGGTVWRKNQAKKTVVLRGRVGFFKRLYFQKTGAEIADGEDVLFFEREL